MVFLAGRVVIGLFGKATPKTVGTFWLHTILVMFPLWSWIHCFAAPKFWFNCVGIWKVVWLHNAKSSNLELPLVRSQPGYWRTMTSWLGQKTSVHYALVSIWSALVVVVFLICHILLQCKRAHPGQQGNLKFLGCCIFCKYDYTCLIIRPI